MTTAKREGLRARRERIGISRERLGRIVDCSHNTIRLAEGGFAGVSDAMVTRISAALDELEREKEVAANPAA
jgi:predicted transcriptional regulator